MRKKKSVQISEVVIAELRKRRDFLLELNNRLVEERRAAEDLAELRRMALEKCPNLASNWVNAEITASAKGSGAKEQEAAQLAAYLFYKNILTSLATTGPAALEQIRREAKVEALGALAAKYDIPGGLFPDVVTAARHEIALLKGEGGNDAEPYFMDSQTPPK